MKILVINGSPKGQYSVTLQTIKYLDKMNPSHQFEVLHAGQKIRALEKDFSQAAEAIKKSDVLLFSYPVYTFIAPCQLHRFIELLKESDIDLTGKYATQLTTSKHFYDVTAHKYIEENCYDMGLKYIKGLSADMEDLLTEQGQREAEDFFKYLCWSVENDSFEPFPAVQPATKRVPATIPGGGEIRLAEQSADATGNAALPEGCTGSCATCGEECSLGNINTEVFGADFISNEDKPGNVVIVTDCEEGDVQLLNMILRFRRILPYKTRIINIRRYKFGGGCLGCFGCAVTGKCVYKDGFDDFLRNEINSAQAIVYAFSIKDHSMGSVFKRYDDRQFCNGHRTVNMGMPVGYLVSGNYSCEHNLQTIIEGRAQVGHNFLAGVATDERNTDEQIDRMANTLCYALENNYVPPQNFYGVGGMKIFRDLIWLMQGMMKADHKFFKAHGQYDFPQKKRGRMIMMHAVGAMLGNEKIKSKMGNKMNEGMLMPYQKVLDACNKKEKR